MKGLGLLFKLYAKSYFGINKLHYTKDPALKKKLRGQLVLVVFVCVMMLGYAYGYCALLGMVFQRLGTPELLLGVTSATAALFMLFTSLFRGGVVLFGYSDFDAVNSLPLSQGTVTGCRVLLLYLSNAFYTLMIMLPAGIVYAGLVRPGPWFYVGYLLTLPLLPAMPTVLAGAVGTLVSALSSGFRRKNIASILLTLVFVGGVMALSFNSQRIVANIDAIAPMLAGTLQRLWPPALLYQNGLTQSPVSAAAFIVMSLALLFLFLRVTSLYSKGIHTRLTSHGGKKRAGRVALKVNTPLRALIKREFARYFASTIYVTNTAIGLLLMTAAAVAVAVLGAAGLEKALEMPGISRVLAPAAPMALSLFVAMSVTTPPSVSIEGNRLWLLKTLPVAYTAIFRAKLLMSLLVAAPFVLLSALLFGIALKVNALSFLLLFLLPMAFALFFGVLGLYMGLCFPNLTWRTEAEVVKQGVPLLVTMFSGMLLAMGGGVLAAVTGEAGGTLTSALLLLALLGGAWLLWGLLAREGTRRLERLL